MKLILILVVVAALAGSLVADYKWRRWMDARRRKRNEEDSRNS